MRVALAIGRPDPLFEARAQPGNGAGAHPGNRTGANQPVFKASTLLVSLTEASEARGWDADVTLIGENVRQTIQKPDVFVNLICEPMVNTAALSILDRYLEQLQLPVLNPAEAVRRSARVALADTLTGHEKVHVPKSTVFDPANGSLAAHIDQKGHAWPVLLRPLGTHGGRGLVKVDDPRQDTGLDFNPSCLVTDYVDFASPDGLFRKHRIIWAGGQTFRRHLITADDWNIKGESRVCMVDRPD